MTEGRKEHPLAPLLLGGFALLLIVVAAVAPSTGAVPSQTNCPYGNCLASSPDYTWYYVGIGVVVALGAAVALLLLMRRRRGPPPGPSQSEQLYGEAPGGAMAPEGPEPPSAGAAYIETPEDVGAPAPTVAPAAAAGAAAGGAEGESDIDSLMQELDRISGEILKRGAPKKGETAPKSDESSGDRAE